MTLVNVSEWINEVCSEARQTHFFLTSSPIEEEAICQSEDAGEWCFYWAKWRVEIKKQLVISLPCDEFPTGKYIIDSVVMNICQKHLDLLVKDLKSQATVYDDEHENSNISIGKEN